MNWYITKLVFQIVTSSNTGTQQFDEQLRLINAESYGKAFEKARIIGKNEEDEFLNNNKQTVKWKFVDVSELTEVKHFIDGMEMHSGIKEMDEASNYTYTIKQKSSSIQKMLVNRPSLTN